MHMGKGGGGATWDQLGGKCPSMLSVEPFLDFFLTINDAIARGWECRLHYYQGVGVQAW